MKHLLLLTLVILAASMGAVPTVCGAEPADTAKELVTKFYKFYCHALNTNADPLTKDRSTLKRYVSERFLKEIDRQSKSEDGLGADPFICAQDLDKDWEKNIKIESADAQGKVARVQVILDGKEIPSHHLAVKLVRAADGWKIERISAVIIE